MDDIFAPQNEAQVLDEETLTDVSGDQSARAGERVGGADAFAGACWRGPRARQGRRVTTSVAPKTFALHIFEHIGQSSDHSRHAKASSRRDKAQGGAFGLELFALKADALMAVLEGRLQTLRLSWEGYSLDAPNKHEAGVPHVKGEALLQAQKAEKPKEAKTQASWIDRLLRNCESHCILFNQLYMVFVVCVIGCRPASFLFCHDIGSVVVSASPVRRSRSPKPKRSRQRLPTEKVLQEMSFQCQYDLQVKTRKQETQAKEVGPRCQVLPREYLPGGCRTQSP